MKKVIVLILLSFLPLVAESSHSFESRKKLSQIKSMNMLVYFYKDNCPYCRHMDTYVMSDPAVEKLIKTSFVYSALDLDSDRAVADGYSIHGSPSFLILSPNGRVLHANTGSMIKEDFVSMLEKFSKNK